MERPEKLIPKEKMVEIIKDLAILNSARTTYVAILQKNDVEPMSYLYAKYGIDSTQFSDSNRYYASIPEEYEEIYSKVEARLEIQKEDVEENKRVKDSMNNKKRKLKREAKVTADSLP